MANFTTYLKIGKPQSKTAIQHDNQNIVDGYGYSNYSWYARLMTGSSQRINKYGEYDQMDEDVEVSRCLDTIADEMTSTNTNTNLPLDLIVQPDNMENIPDSTISTLNAALRYWVDIHDLDFSMFDIARNLVKYGDVFFKRADNSSTKKWTYIAPQLVKAAMVDENDVTNIIGWQIHRGNTVANSDQFNSLTNQEQECDVMSSEKIIRFTLNTNMSVQAPFGVSVLQSVYKAHKQKDLIEDAIIIYRIQRAPERRVFYLDTAGMPPHRVKKYMENVKTEIRQRKIPSTSGGQSTVDSTYNPQSIGEDFFFSIRGDKGSRVETLPGGASVGETSDLEYFTSKLYRGLRIPSSYMQQEGDGAVFNDGRVGFAYIQELNFSKYVQRLQRNMSSILDDEFKTFLRAVGIAIDKSIFKIQLPPPNNFAVYKQQALDSQLLTSYTTAQDNKMLSERFKLKKYLQLTEEEILRNEQLKAEEMGIELRKESDIKIIQKLYGDPDLMGDELGDGGGGETGGETSGDVGGDVVTP